MRLIIHLVTGAPHCSPWEIFRIRSNGGTLVPYFRPYFGRIFPEPEALYMVGTSNLHRFLASMAIELLCQAGIAQVTVFNGSISRYVSLVIGVSLWQTQITMQNHHVSWVNPLQMVMFDSYVTLPEGIIPFRTAIGDLSG